MFHTASPTRTRRLGVAALAAAGLVLGAGPGCSGVRRVAELEVFDARDEVRPAAFTGGGGVARPPRPEVVEAPGPELVARASGSAETLTLRADPGLPGYVPAAPVEGAVLVDAKVGDINGTPVYAGEFLGPLEARLVAEAERLPMRTWVTLASREIKRSLDLMVTDELLRAEALARLTPDQRQGLRGFLETFREDLISQSMGSEELAQRRLQEQEGLSIDERVAQEEQLTLVRLNLAEQFTRGVSVSWRDIEQRYERDFELYNPPPTAVFRLIRVATADAGAVERVRAALGSGEAFEAVAASDDNTFNPDTDGAYEVRFEGAYGEHKFFGADELNRAAWSLAEGEWAGPIEFGTQTGWLRLERVRRESTSLYEAQLQIERELLVERRQTVLDRYMNRLLERSGIEDVEQIRRRLLDIAIERYAPQA